MLKFKNTLNKDALRFVISYRLMNGFKQLLMIKNRIKTVILCDGRQPGSGPLKKELDESEYFIAADGGGNVARRLNLSPDIVIGDMDSYVPAENEKAKIIHDADQETNDLEKSLNHALKLKSTDVVVFGAVGRRLDHTLKNLSVLCRFKSSFSSLVFKDIHGEIFLLPRKFIRTYPVGTTLSLFPISGIAEGISTKGLAYTLTDESLENGVRDGTSNKSVSPEIEITHKKGDLLLFVASLPEDWGERS